MSTVDVTAVERLLEQDPAGFYTAMDGATRGRYIRACEQLAEWSQREPAEVAREAVLLAQAPPSDDVRGRHVGTYLIAEGRPQLEARLGCRVPSRERLSRVAHRHAATAYVGTLVALTALSLAGVERLLASRGMEPLHRVLLLVLLVFPVLEILQERVDKLLARLVKDAGPLPRLEPARVLAPDTRTLVVTPLLITSAEDIDQQLRKLENNYLGNISPDLLFALLTDFGDAQDKELPGERELVERLEHGLRELNARHGFTDAPRFLLLHRERRWNPVARRWMGWERKRGKLEEFNRLVLGARDTSYTGPVPDVVHTVRYVITLDADNQLIPGSAALLVATLHHPLNRAKFDASGQRVIAGYSMLQPTIQESPSRSEWLASGGWPVSIVSREQKAPPDQAMRALGQNLFGVGEFFGKGIYDVAAFTRSLEGRIPENIVLSHDKLEGMFSRVAFAFDVTLLEGRPRDLASMGRIWHRWIRGDWQLLPWLLPWVPTRSGRWVPNTLSLLDRWKLLADLRTSLGRPMMLPTFAYGWLLLPADSVGAWTLGVSLWCCRYPLFYASAATLRTALRKSREESPAAALGHIAYMVPRILRNAAMDLGVLVPLSGIVLDAIVRALYRLAFDRTRILDWTTHAQTRRKVDGLSSFALPEVRAGLVLALGWVAVVAVFNPRSLPWACPLLLAWTPFVVLIRQGGGVATPPLVLESEELARLRALARRSWALYEHMGPTGQELPWRMLAENGAPTEAAETRPEDLALWLVAPLSAYHLGYLGLDGLGSRLEASLTTLERLERHRGHLFERYDARTGLPLAPRRICVAGSGMLAAALTVLESGLHAVSKAPHGTGPLRQGVADTLAVLGEEAGLAPPSARRERLAGVLRLLREWVADGSLPLDEVLARIQRQRASLAAERIAHLNAVPAEAASLATWWDRFEHQLSLLEGARQMEAPTPLALERLAGVEARVRALREAMRFAFLVESGSSEEAHAGRFASGALLAAFMAIARREVPLQHWLTLVESDERPREEEAVVARRAALGEHLPPTLFLWFPPATLLGHSANAALEADVGAARGLPWGLDEPPRGIQGDPPVTALPHLSVLALRFRTRDALANLSRLLELGALGRYGLFDSVRVSTAAPEPAVRRQFTCRYQGMVLATVTNLACDDILIQHFHRHRETAWVEGLIYETKSAA
ncbi:hypothetical protein JRI60_25885 [Archangium violaceum]|uniref:hypothetical protein n=1 Tax=Archangium violaceum TaxID=83451 RepID=UPI00194EF10D|nr:hypothetical protein [Archangium violaceum]QRO02200.1 hypothetical protein JRI60_25885 [Archangium violaceum]